MLFWHTVCLRMQPTYYKAAQCRTIAAQP